jgi:tyrosine decarboxylase/aspartate 1-decarboxylase
MPTDLPDEFFTRLADAQATLDRGFSRLPPAPQPALDEHAAAILAEAATLLSHDDPYHHPLYAGQMLKPPHPIARAAYAFAMALNPNNHALDGGRASSAMELEAVAALARMFGLRQHLGHLTSGGTFANLEALWIAGQLARATPRQISGQLAAEQGSPNAIAASTQAHYTHTRISAVLGLPFVAIPTDHSGRMDIAALESALQTQTIGTVVATLGTTATGAVDPLPRILELQARYKFRIHVDAAYGGYFTLASNLAPETRAAFDAIPHADSIVIDPHKHGLQPYGCGCVLFRDPGVGRFYKHDSPYTYFTSKDLHLGEISLECSRAGASAVALWATQKLLPYTPGGAFAQGLEDGRKAALTLHKHLATHPEFVLPITPPQLDIVVWAARAATPEASSARAQDLFDRARSNDLYLALARLPTNIFPPGTWPASETQQVTCLRSVLMKPEHLAWIDEIWTRFQNAAEASSL